MLSSLYVKNLALMEECDITLYEGLNILTGETGAGKSILIGSINLALGAKADKDMIRHGCEFALVELQFEKLDASILTLLEALDIPVEEDHSVLIQRKITATRSTCKVNGQTVTAKQLKELAEHLIDIHGQHEHQSLLKHAKHMEIVDTYAGEKATTLLLKLHHAYANYTQTKKVLAEACLDENERKRELDFIQFELEEVDQASIEIGEDDLLDAQYNKLKNSVKINESLQKAVVLTDFDEGCGLYLSQALKELTAITHYDKELKDIEAILMDTENLLSDFSSVATHYIANMEFDEEAFFEIEKRLNILNHLKSKHGPTLEDVLVYYEKQKTRLEILQNYEIYLADLYRQQEKAFEEVRSFANELTLIREAAAKELSKLLTDSLLELNFLDVTFDILLTKKDEPTNKGFEDIVFMISTNPGEPIKPIAQVASGGELSRIMLAIKTVLAQKDAIDTLIFDEIDVGISGKTAWKVSQKLGELAKAHQIICITHLPQIAAMADKHYFIHKDIVDTATRTSIEALDQTSSIEELARMLGADSIDETALEHARSLKQQAMKNN